MTPKTDAKYNSAVLPRRQADGRLAAWCMVGCEARSLHVSATMHDHAAFAVAHLASVHGWAVSE